MGLERLREGERQRNPETDSNDPTRVFGKSYAHLISQVPGRTKAARAQEAGWHRSTVHGFETGKMLPPEGEVDRLGELIFSKTGHSAEALEEAKENYLRALETKQPMQQLAAAKVKMTELIRRAEAAEVETATAYSELASAQDQLARFRASRVAGADDQQRWDQEDRLLGRLARAAQAVHEILEQQQQTIRELRTCAKELVDAANAYLAHAAYIR